MRRFDGNVSLQPCRPCVVWSEQEGLPSWRAVPNIRVIVERCGGFPCSTTIDSCEVEPGFQGVLLDYKEPLRDQIILLLPASAAYSWTTPVSHKAVMSYYTTSSPASSSSVTGATPFSFQVEAQRQQFRQRANGTRTHFALNPALMAPGTSAGAQTNNSSEGAKRSHHRRHRSSNDTESIFGTDELLDGQEETEDLADANQQRLESTSPVGSKGSSLYRWNTRTIERERKRSAASSELSSSLKHNDKRFAEGTVGTCRSLAHSRIRAYLFHPFRSIPIPSAHRDAKPSQSLLQQPPDSLCATRCGSRRRAICARARPRCRTFRWGQQQRSLATAQVPAAPVAGPRAYLILCLSVPVPISNRAVQPDAASITSAPIIHSVDVADLDAPANTTGRVCREGH